jgi:arylsulfatase A-like enzyme
MGVADLFADGKKPNLVFIITDQERSLQHWPENFAKENLPALMRLMTNGLTFSQAFTGACMCSPSRATFLTSQFPAHTGVTMTGSPEPRTHLPKDLSNLATVLHKAGYTCAWRGKWHLGGGGPEDYGFTGWKPPDAGNYLSLNDTLGGGTPDNDGRFLKEIIDFIDQADQIQPFCLVASFVNPHDVYVAQHDPTLGYTKADFNKVTVPLPSNKDEDLTNNNKPRAHVTMSWPRVHFENSHQDYVNFYAYLHTLVDGQILQLLDRLDHNSLTEDTLIIRTADHGEQALSHSLVEKFYNAYEESIRIPLVFSNPIAYQQPETTHSLASLVDLVPTLAQLLGVAKDFSGCFFGRDLTPVLENPRSSAQDLVHFTYDDIPSRDAPSIIRCIRTARYKYAVYFTPNGDDADWELYDLEEDPDENDNKAGQPAFEAVQFDLDQQLCQVMKEMKTEPSLFAWPPVETEISRGGSKHMYR